MKAKSRPSQKLSEQDITKMLNSPLKSTKSMKGLNKETSKNMRVTEDKKSFSQDSVIDLVDSDVEDDNVKKDSLSEIVLDQSLTAKKGVPLTKPLKVNVMTMKVKDSSQVDTNSLDSTKVTEKKSSKLTKEPHNAEVNPSKLKMKDLILENVKLKDELASAKAHLQSLEVKIPQMINDFTLTFNKHIEESNKLKQELKEMKDQAKTEEDKNEVFNLKAMLKASEAKLKNKEKEITNLSKKSNEAAKNVKSKESQLDDANKKIKKLQEEVKQKTSGKSKAHQEQNDTIKKFEKDIDLKMRELSVVSKRLTKLEDEKVDNGKQIQKQSQIISDLSQKLKNALKDKNQSSVELEEARSKSKIYEDKFKKLETDFSSSTINSKSLRDEVKKSNEELKKKSKIIDDLKTKLSKEDENTSKRLKEVEQVNKSKRKEYVDIINQYVIKIASLEKSLNEEKDVAENLKSKNKEQICSFEKTLKDVKDLNDSFKKEQRKIILEYNEKLESKDLLLREKALEHSEKLSKVYQKVEEKDLLIMELKSNVLELKSQIGEKDLEIRKHISRSHELRREFDKEVEVMKFEEINRANNIRHEMLLQQKNLRDKLVNDHEAALSSLERQHQDKISQVQDEMASKIEKKRLLLRKVVKVVNYKKTCDNGSETRKVQGLKLPITCNWPLVRYLAREFALTNIGKEFLRFIVSAALRGFQFPHMGDVRRGIKRKQNFEEDSSSKKVKNNRNENILMLSYSWPLVLYKPSKIPIISIHPCLMSWPGQQELTPVSSLKRKLNQSNISGKKLRLGNGHFGQLLPAVAIKTIRPPIFNLMTKSKKRKADLINFEDVKVKVGKLSILPIQPIVRNKRCFVEESVGEPLVKRMRFTNDFERDIACLVYQIVDSL